MTYFVLVVFGLLGGTAYVLAERGAADGRRMVGDVARTLGASVAEAVAPALARGDAAAVGAIIRAAGGDGSVLRLAVTDATGATVAASALDPGPAGMSPRAATPPWAATPQPISVGMPVVARTAGGRAVVGRVLVSVDDGPLVRGHDATLQAIGLVGVGVSTSAVLLSWLFRRCAMRPLKQLMASAKRIVAGDLDATIAVSDDDVVGDLAGAFNELVSWIRDHRAQIDAANRATADAIADLERKVESRTAQLEGANERLSGEIAEKEDFLRAVSHDLNAPLRNIGGMVAMLMRKNREELSPEVVARLERIQKNVEVETDLINELLELSRIKTRRQTLEVVDVESLVWDLRGMFENDLKTRHIELVLETSLPSLYAERARVRQVFQNLIDNAIKYMGEGPAREIRIGCRVAVTEAEFYVRDTGLGIHPEDLDKVFFVFRRGRGEAASRVPGKGVGLSSVKSIVETYAGRIWVQSTLGAGTTFRFTINGKYVPAVAGGAPAEMAGQAVASGPTLAAPANGSRAA